MHATPELPLPAATEDASPGWAPTTGKDLVWLLRPVMRAIAVAVGPQCEVVLHDLSQGLDQTILVIENGHLTGRSVGGSSTNLGLAALQSPDADPNAYGYKSTTSDGRELRSSSVYFRNVEGQLVAALCINVDLTTFQSVRGLMEEMLDFPGAIAQEEIFAGDIDDVLSGMITDALHQARTPVATMTKSDRVRVIRTLENRGAFVIKSAVDTVARRLSISRVTVYSYLDEVRSTDTT